MDIVSAHAISEAVALLAAEFSKGAASEAAKTAWEKITKLLGWHKTPSPEAVAADVKKKLEKDPALLSELKTILHEKDRAAGALVQQVNAQNAVIAESIHVSGDFKMGK